MLVSWPEEKLKKMLREAMKERVPKLYRSLESEGTLEQELEQRAQQMSGELERRHFQALESAQNEASKEPYNHLNVLQAMHMAGKRVEEEILDEYLNF